MSAPSPRTAGVARLELRVPIALVALSVVPLVAGGLRSIELGGGSAVLPSNPPLSAAPVPFIVHIVGATLFSLLGGFQFATARGSRRSRSRACG